MLGWLRVRKLRFLWIIGARWAIRPKSISLSTITVGRIKYWTTLRNNCRKSRVCLRKNIFLTLLSKATSLSSLIPSLYSQFSIRKLHNLESVTREGLGNLSVEALITIHWLLSRQVKMDLLSLPMKICFFAHQTPLSHSLSQFQSMNQVRVALAFLLRKPKIWRLKIFTVETQQITWTVISSTFKIVFKIAIQIPREKPTVPTRLAPEITKIVFILEPIREGRRRRNMTTIVTPSRSLIPSLFVLSSSRRKMVRRERRRIERILTRSR